MLKSIYETLDAIPEGDRPHYALSEGKYVLQLDDQHPVAVKNRELLREKSADKGAMTKLANEKTALETEKAALTAERDALKGSSLPAGHVAIPAADAQLLTAYKSHGTPDDVKAAKEERDALKSESASLKRAQVIRRAADLHGYDADVMAELLPADVELAFGEVEREGKKVELANAKFKEGDALKEQPLEEYVDAKLKKYLPSLRPEQPAKGTQYVKQNPQGKAPAKNVFDRIREEAKAAAEAKKPTAKPLNERLGILGGSA